ncbi:MAG: hypothetical protein MI862_04235 [Desulfobacterales bacterium]|nr:hypothetical protein [Desulfobacterales bacterium]
MADTPSVVTPCRLASGTLLKAREAVQPMAHMLNKNLMVDLGRYILFIHRPNNTGIDFFPAKL